MVDLGIFDFLVLFAFLLIIILWIRSRRPTGFPPGPSTIPVIGNMHNIAKGHVLETFRELRTKYGDIFSLSLGQFWVIVVNGTENLKELLVKNGEYTSDRPPLFFLELFVKKGIFSASGPTWKQQRTFAITKLKGFGFGKRSFESRIIEEVGAFLDLMNSYKGEPFDLTGILNTSMANNVMSITIGRRFDYDDPEFVRFIELVNDVASNPTLAGPVNFVPSLSKLPGDPFRLTPVITKVDVLFDFFRTLIKEHVETFDDSNIRDFTDACIKEMKKDAAVEYSGRRTCPGESIARIELFLYLTTFVQRFEFLPPEGEGPPPIEAILATTNGPKPYKFRAISRHA